MTIDAGSRFAVFSDVHGNLAALRVFLEEMDREGVENLICLGDVVGYGPFPNECCEMIRRRGIPTVLGNHDAVCIDEHERQYFNDNARLAIDWTSAVLSEDNLAWLRSLPLMIEEGDLCFVHASPRNPREWEYVLSQGEALRNFQAFASRVGFIGHSHQPVLIELWRGRVECPELGPRELLDDRRYMVNVGSVGQPRDHDPRLCYVEVDARLGRVAFRRLEYPVRETQEAIRKTDLPVQLAERLEHGW